MLITQIFGKYLLDTHEYVGWLKSKEGHEFVANMLKKIRRRWTPIEHIIIKDDLTNQAHTILYQPMTDECLEMFKGEWNMLQIYTDTWELRYDDKAVVVRHRNGHWLTKGGATRIANLNAFATHCHSKNIPLELNETFEA